MLMEIMAQEKCCLLEVQLTV